MINVTVIYDDLDQIEPFNGSTYSVKFHLIDSKSKKGKKEAWRVKNYYGAKLNPFAVVLDKDKPIKAFYSEAEDVIDSLIKYLNNNEKENNCKCD